MVLPQIFSNRQFRGVAIGIAVIILTFVIINGFAIGGDTFIFSLGSSLNAPLAIVITLFAASIYRLMGYQKHPRFLWAGLIIGWGLWAFAETLWLV